MENGSSVKKIDQYVQQKKIMFPCICSVKIGSMSVSDQLSTYPSPNPTLILTCYQLTVVELGEEKVCSCSDTDIDPGDHRWCWNVVRTRQSSTQGTAECDTDAPTLK